MSKINLKILDNLYEDALEAKFDNAVSFYGKANIEDNGNKLYSYDTLVAEIKDGKPIIYNAQSQTTRRHIREYLLQKGFSLEDIDKLFKEFKKSNNGWKSIGEAFETRPIDNMEDYEVYDYAASLLSNKELDFDTKMNINKILNRIDNANRRGVGYAEKANKDLRELIKGLSEKEPIKEAEEYPFTHDVTIYYGTNEDGTDDTGEIEIFVDNRKDFPELTDEEIHEAFKNDNLDIWFNDLSSKYEMFDIKIKDGYWLMYKGCEDSGTKPHFVIEKDLIESSSPNAINTLVKWMYDHYNDCPFIGEGKLGNGNYVYKFDIKRGTDIDKLKADIKNEFGNQVEFGTAVSEYAPEIKNFVVICKAKKNMKESEDKKPTKRLVMNQGNVYIFEQSKGSKKSYIVGEDVDKDANTIENVNKYKNQDEAFKDFFERIGIDPSNELKESIKEAAKLEVPEENTLYVYSNAESEDESDARSMIDAQYKNEAPNLDFNMHKDGPMYFVDFIGSKEDIADYLKKLGWYTDEEIEKFELIKPLRESSKTFKGRTIKEVEEVKDKEAYLIDTAREAWSTGQPYSEGDFEEFKKIGKEEGYDLTEEDFSKYFDYYKDCQEVDLKESDDIEGEEPEYTQEYTVEDLDKMTVGIPVAITLKQMFKPKTITALYSGKYEDTYYFYDEGGNFAFSKKYIENGDVFLTNGVDPYKVVELIKSLEQDK